MTHNNSKHAYLIIAHDKIKLLQFLLSSIDDSRNDIYVHIDKKASFDGNQLIVNRSNLYLIKERLDARWGDFSLVEVELALMKAASRKGTYSYFHIISGVDIPLKTQDFIHSACEEGDNKEFIGIAEVTEDELDFRSGHYFVFSRCFNSKNFVINVMRRAFLKCQDLFGYHRNGDIQLKKGSQWCSITSELVEYLLEHEAEIRKRFRYTFCPDEVFIPTLCWNSPFRAKICNLDDEFDSCRRYIKWNNGALEPITISDTVEMKKSNRWFARKIMNIEDAITISSQLFDNE